MRWLSTDGDVWLLVLFIGAGVLPVVGDVWRGRPLGAEATLGALMVVVCTAALMRRLALLVRAVRLRRSLLAREVEDSRTNTGRVPRPRA